MLSILIFLSTVAVEVQYDKCAELSRDGQCRMDTVMNNSSSTARQSICYYIPHTDYSIQSLPPMPRNVAGRLRHLTFVQISAVSGLYCRFYLSHLQQ